MGIPIINGEGIKSFQSADYNTYYALAEIIDNSITAGANNIHIIGIQRDYKGRKRLLEVIIYDDGKGMDLEIANNCLRFGGGSNLGAKKGISKFGMGLPQASGSQCDRTEVYTWQNNESYIYTYLDYS